jgi:hypothetical protein
MDELEKLLKDQLEKDDADFKAYMKKDRLKMIGCVVLLVTCVVANFVFFPIGG